MLENVSVKILHHLPTQKQCHYDVDDPLSELFNIFFILVIVQSFTRFCFSYFHIHELLQKYGRNAYRDIQSTRMSGATKKVLEI